MSRRVQRGYVLAGGLSTRMGQDKAQMRVGGVPMAAVVADVLTEAGLEVWIVRRASDEDAEFVGKSGRSYPLCIEAHDRPRHPLWGVVSALQHAQGDPVLVAPCDVPDLTQTEVRSLLQASRPAVAWDGERVHGLSAVVGNQELALAEATARDGGSVRSFVAGFERVRLCARALRNRNSPGD